MTRDLLLLAARVSAHILFSPPALPLVVDVLFLLLQSWFAIGFRSCCAVVVDGAAVGVLPGYLG